MKYVMFLQDLGLSRDEAREMLKRAAGSDYQALWSDDPLDVDKKKDVDVVVTSKHKVGEAELREFPAARMVSLAFTGYNDLDEAYCKSRQLNVYFVPDYSTDSVAELATFMAGVLLRRLSIAHEQIELGEWDRPNANNFAVVPGLQLRGRTVGIIGTGTIGLRTAEIFRYGYRCPLIGWSRNRKDEFTEMGGIYCDHVDDVFRQAHIVSLHVQLVEETENMVSAERIASMKSDAVLINCARTGLIDLDALVTALKGKKILGAGLDVTEQEHLRDDLIGLDNLILTPHIGYRTDHALKQLALKTIENIGRFARGDPTNRLLPEQ
jgi:phosphoglycerate dehydrogenase-like enzyme